MLRGEAQANNPIKPKKQGQGRKKYTKDCCENARGGTVTDGSEEVEAVMWHSARTTFSSTYL